MGNTEKQDKINVVVHYMGAIKPFHDNDASPSETLSSLKNRVLTAFGLSESTLPDGNVVTYHLFLERQEVTDLTQTLGFLAAGKKELQFNLVQRLTQGSAE